MDLAIGAKQVFVMMSLFTRNGTSKLVEACTYPLTARRCVSGCTPTTRCSTSVSRVPR